MWYKWKHCFLLSCLLLLSILLAPVEEAHSRSVPEDISNNTDIHFNNKYCTVCHEKGMKKGSNILLKFNGNYTQLCRCHGYDSGTYIHPVDVVPSEEKRQKIPEEFPLIDGKISCPTCHDITLQCEDRRLTKAYRKSTMFLRGVPFKKRTDICFRCHDEKKYKMLDPHNQLDENGNIIVLKCLYCHVEEPDVNKSSFKDVKLVGDLRVLCERCHGVLDKHPGNAFHFRKPSQKTLQRMKMLEAYYDTILPLDYNGNVTCATCHNPYEKGVLPEKRKGARGAGVKFRHRLPSDMLPEDMCKACHGM
jgi:hypothetical protein